MVDTAMTGPRPEAVALLAEAIRYVDEAMDDDLPEEMFAEAATQGSEPYARAILTHPPLAAALETDRLAREWWEGVVSGRNVGKGGSPFQALVDHLRATR